MAGYYGCWSDYRRGGGEIVDYRRGALLSAVRGKRVWMLSLDWSY